VTTTARGDAADRLRSFFASRRRDEVSREYLDFYAERYPSVQTAKALSVDDDAENDVFRTFEHYSITGFWKPGSTEGASVAELYPDLVRSEIPAPRSKSRTKPLEVEYPRHVLQYISVDLPEAWKIKAEDTTETTDAFALSTKISCIGSSLSLAYDYSARAAEVAPDKMAKYNLDVQRIKDDLGYQLTLGGPRETAASGTTDSSFALIGTGVLAVLVVGGGVAISRAMARRRATAGIAMPLAGSQPFGLPAIGPTGLGGWLVLVGLAVIAQSVVSALNLARIVPLFSPGSWHDLAVPGGARYHPLWAPMLFLEAFDAIGMGLAGIYLAVLFFERRASFPNLFIWVRAAGAALVLADSMLGLWLPETANDWQARFNQIAQAVTSCAIWIPYMLRSRRVKNTFTR
jgi:hypothetical protein